MNESIAILGRQPAFGFAELENLYGSSNVMPLSGQIAQIHLDPYSIDFNRLGSVIKLCRLVKVFDGLNWSEIENFLIESSLAYASLSPKGKLNFGTSVYGLSPTTKDLNSLGLRIKKIVSQKSNRSIRLVPNLATALSTAQVLHNKLLSKNGWEFIIVSHGSQVIVGKTIFLQDIESYGLRDFGRPLRDARIGMLPPKLAQIIINLTTQVGAPNTNKASATDNQASIEALGTRVSEVILDPFCGTGVLLQEAILMGYSVIGTDINPKMIDYSQKNLDWLSSHYNLPMVSYKLHIGDSTKYQWSEPIYAVATEAYLGHPFVYLPTGDVLDKTVADCDVIIRKVLNNISNQLEPGTRLCVAVPAWQIKPSLFRHLPLIDQISNMGYNRLSFEHAKNEDLIYCRPNQIVARELLVLIKK